MITQMIFHMFGDIWAECYIPYMQDFYCFGLEKKVFPHQALSSYQNTTLYRKSKKIYEN